MQFVAACCQAIGLDQAETAGRGTDVLAAMRSLRVTGGCTEIAEQQLAFTPAEERDLARLLDVPGGLVQPGRGLQTVITVLPRAWPPASWRMASGTCSSG